MFQTVGTTGTAGTNGTVLVCSPLVETATPATPVRSNTCAAWSNMEVGFQLDQESGDHRKTQGAEIPIERQARHTVEKGCDDDERDSVAKGYAATTAVSAEYQLGFVPHPLAILHNRKIRFNLFQKCHCWSETDSIA